MTNVTIPIERTNRPANAMLPADGGLVRQGADTEDRGFLYSQVITMLLTNLFGTLGTGIRIKEGTNAKAGIVTLAAGTATVANTSVTANSRIKLTAQSLGTVTSPKTVAVTARTAGVNFVITSADATDTSVIYWEMNENL